MSKNKNPQKQVLLSPENYIRQKGRNLPIYKCLVNCDWEEGQLASILIARQHANGNITSCFYLVDTACLGVKDTVWHFNETIDEYLEFEQQMGRQMEMQEISYELAHNIIYSALEYANDYGFRAHKDFTATTQFFLAEDTDEIPLMEIHCGDENGEPLFISNGYEPPARVRQILNTLEKTAGRGNFTFIDNVNNSDNENDDEDYDDDEYEDEDFYEEEEKKYLKIYKEYKDSEFDVILSELDGLGGELHKNTMNDLRFLKLRALTDIVANRLNLIKPTKVIKYKKLINNDLNYQTIQTNTLPNSLFEDISVKNVDDFVKEYLFLAGIVFIDNDGCIKMIDSFEKKYGKNPAIEYLRLLKLDLKQNDDQFDDLLKQLLKLYPDYFLFKIYEFKQKNADKDIDKKTKKELFEIIDNVGSITDFEFDAFVTVYYEFVYRTFKQDEDLEKIVAFDEYLKDELLHERKNENCYLPNLMQKNMLLTLNRWEKVRRIMNFLGKIAEVFRKSKDYKVKK